MILVIATNVIALIICCVILNFTCDKLGDRLESIATDIEMDRDVAGATFLAVSSSVPEFLTSFISIVFLKQFNDVGFATIAGSGIFNILLIPMFAILAYKGNQKIQFDPEVGKRDLGFYMVSIFALTLSMYLGAFTWLTGAVLVGVYMLYVRSLMKGQTKPIRWHKACREDISLAVLWLVPIAVVIHFAIDFALTLATTLGVSGFVISVIVLAGVTSIPDLLLSVREARKGEIDSATSNAVGSNIFDICCCLGLPLLVTGANVATNFKSDAGIAGFLFLSSLVTASVMFTGATKKKTIPMLATYLVFVAYIAYKAVV